MPNNHRAPVRTHKDIIDRDGSSEPAAYTVQKLPDLGMRPCSKCGGRKDGKSTSSMCKACERAYRYERRNGKPPGDRTLPGARTAPVPDRQDTPEVATPALPVPPPRFVPVVRKEPLRRSTRAERMNEIRPEWRHFFTPCNVPDGELTPEELRARRRKEGRR